MISPYDYLIIGVYLGFLPVVGWLFRRFNRASNDYFAGGFRVSWWMLGASSFISNFSTWLFTGAANIAYKYGMLIFGFYAIDVLGFAISWLWFAPRFRQLRLVTAMDAIRLRFGESSEQFFTWLNFISTLGIAAVWLVSLSVICSTAFEFPPVPVICVTGAVVTSVALFGGAWAVIATDFVQLLVLVAVTTVASVLTLARVGGIKAFLAQIPADHWRLFHRAGSIPYDWLYLITGLIGATYMKNNFTYAAKYIAAKDGAEARRSALIPLIGYTVMPVIWFIPPLAAFTLVPDLARHSVMRVPGEAAYIAVVLQVLPRGLLGLMIAALFSATMASMDVALNKNAGFFVRNFYRPILRPAAGDQELLVVGQLATALFGVGVTALALAVVLETRVSLFDAFLYLNAYLGVPLFLPMFLGMLVRRVPSWAAWATTLVGMATTAFFYNLAPLPAVAGWLRPLIGPAAYSYILTNKFVITNLVTVPCTMAFFVATMLWYRAGRDRPYDQEVDRFFTRMNTPVDYQREVGGDGVAQRRMLSRITCGCAALVSLIVLVPNAPVGRVAIAACAAFLWAVGLALLLFSHPRRTSTAS